MKINYVSDQFLPSSSADTEQFINMIAALSKQADVELLSAKYQYKKPPSLKKINEYYFTDGTFKVNFVKHYFPNIRGIEKIVFCLKSAFRIRKNQDIDVVYTRNIPVLISTLLCTQKPILYETFRPWPMRNSVSHWFFKKIKDHPRFLGIVLHSNFAKKAFLDVGFRDEQLIVEHNAFRKDFFVGAQSEKHVIREKFGIPKNKITVTYTGRVTEQKGLNYLLKLADTFPDVLFLIVGSEQEGEIEMKAKKRANVRVIEWQNKASTAKYILASDILYIPTSLMAREKAMNTVLPIKTFMYKASGKAIFGPDIEDIREVLTHNKTALLVKPDDTEAAAEGMRVLLKDEKLREKLGLQAKAEMASLTWENRAERIIHFIENRLERLS